MGGSSGLFDWLPKRSSGRGLLVLRVGLNGCYQFVWIGFKNKKRMLTTGFDSV